MVYQITITQTTGKIIEQVQFTDLTLARNFYQQILDTTSFRRVLILLLEKPSPYEENILEVEFVEGITYVHPSTTYSSTSTTTAPKSDSHSSNNSAGKSSPEYTILSPNHSSSASAN